MSKINELVAETTDRQERIKATFSLSAVTYTRFRGECDRIGLDYSKAVDALMEDFSDNQAAKRTATQAPDTLHVGLTPPPTPQPKRPTVIREKRTTWRKKKQD